MFHNQFKPFGPQPIREQGAWPRFPNPPIWPKPLVGKALEWRYVGTAPKHVWIIREAVSTGLKMRLWGERVWSEVGTSPETTGEESVVRVLTAAIGRAFSGQVLSLT